MRSRPGFLALLLAAGLAIGGVARAAVYDWNRWADLETVEVISTDEDGGARLTTVWIIVLDHFPYLRTAGTTWGDNVERADTIQVRNGTDVRIVEPTAVTEDSHRELVIAAFREKYGFSDALLDFVRGDARIWSLRAR